MISNPFFLLSVLTSSVLAFFTAALVIDLLIKTFKIKNHRVRSTLRVLPFLSLITDLLFNQYSIAYWINPLNCSSCMQKFILEIFFPQLKEYLTQNKISLINHLGFAHQNSFFSTIFILFGTVSLFFVLKRLIQALSSIYSLHFTIKRAINYTNSIDSVLLTQEIQKSKANIYLSNEIQVPLTVYPNIIVIPEKTMEILSQKEFEAVIAHELEHIKYRDSLTRLLTHLIAAFFWWVPTHRWIKKLDQEQELACDQNVSKYDICNDSIATALFKVARQVKTRQAICYFTGQENSTLMRIQHILGMRTEQQGSILGLNFFGVFFGGLFLWACMMYL